MEGHSTPVFDISNCYGLDDTRDLLIRNVTLGGHLAPCFSLDREVKAEDTRRQVPYAVVLMRGHGFTAVASTIQECVFRAIFTQKNAVVQTTTIELSAAYSQLTKDSGNVCYLCEDEIAPTAAMSNAVWNRAWGSWVGQIEAENLYIHEQ